MRTFVYLPGSNEHLNLAQVERVTFGSDFNPTADVYLADGRLLPYEGTANVQAIHEACLALRVVVERPVAVEAAAIPTASE